MLILDLLCHLDHLHLIDHLIDRFMTRLLRKRCLGILWISIPLPVNQPLYNHDSKDDRSKESSTHPTLANDNQRDKDDIHNDNDDDDDVIVEHSLADAHSSLRAGCPFTFLYLSSEDSTREDPSHHTEHDASLTDSSSTRQGTTHVQSLPMRC